MNSGPQPTAHSPQPDSAHLSRLRWHCRRGMRELDVLFMNYFDQRYPDTSRTEQAAFEALLELPDPVILAYLTGVETPESPEISDVIRQLTRSGA